MAKITRGLISHFNDVKWARRCLKSPVSRLFTQPFIQAQIREKTSKLRVNGLCAGNSPVTGEFPAQMASNAENVSIWWRHHVIMGFCCWGMLCELHDVNVINTMEAELTSLSFCMYEVIFWKIRHWWIAYNNILARSLNFLEVFAAKYDVTAIASLWLYYLFDVVI